MDGLRITICSGGGIRKPGGVNCLACAAWVAQGLNTGDGDICELVLGDWIVRGLTRGEGSWRGCREVLEVLGGVLDKVGGGRCLGEMPLCDRAGIGDGHWLCVVG
jgi:hypothetical protein